ncbi:MAG: glucoamylase family protein, partial [Acholeplasmataceae bacterium]|nr:glucoamylase family protein [Acholeplasmataceae bacterium]
MDNNILIDIQKTAYDFFKDFTNFEADSKGFGLTLDHSMNLEKASIASTGFMLSSLIIGVKHEYLIYEEAYHKAYHTLITLKDNIMHEFGFFAHFLDFKTGERIGKTEFSTIDTALCLCGVLSVDSFFKDEQISYLTQIIMDRIDWELFSFTHHKKLVLHMAFNPDRGGDYVEKRPGFIHQWDMFAEQLTMYVMVGGSKYKHIAKDLYNGFIRAKGSYKDFHYIYSPGNSLFVYQFPQAWLNLKDIIDEDQISWFDNAKTATLAHQACAMDNMHQF